MCLQNTRPRTPQNTRRGQWLLFCWCGVERIHPSISALMLGSVPAVLRTSMGTRAASMPAQDTTRSVDRYQHAQQHVDEGPATWVGSRWCAVAPGRSAGSGLIAGILTAFWCISRCQAELRRPHASAGGFGSALLGSSPQVNQSRRRRPGIVRRRSSWQQRPPNIGIARPVVAHSHHLPSSIFFPIFTLLHTHPLPLARSSFILLPRSLLPL